MALAHESIGRHRIRRPLWFPPRSHFKLAQLVIDPPEAHPRDRRRDLRQGRQAFLRLRAARQRGRHHESVAAHGRAGQLRIPGGDWRPARRVIRRVRGRRRVEHESPERPTPPQRALPGANIANKPARATSARVAAADLCRHPRFPRPNAEEDLDISTLEKWLWDAACAIRGATDAPKFKDFILPLVFFKRLSDVFDDEFAAT